MNGPVHAKNKNRPTLNPRYKLCNIATTRPSAWSNEQSR